MGWGTSFNAEIYISRKTWNSIGELEQDIKDKEESIAMSISTLKSLVSYAPKDVNDMQESLQIFDDYMGGLEEEYTDLYKMYMLKELLDEDKNIDIKTLQV